LQTLCHGADSRFVIAHGNARNFGIFGVWAHIRSDCLGGQARRLINDGIRNCQHVLV